MKLKLFVKIMIHSRNRKMIFKFETLENLNTFCFSKNYLLIFLKSKILIYDIQKVLLSERLVFSINLNN